MPIRGSLLIILVLVLSLHIGLLMLKIAQKKIPPEAVADEKALNLRILKEKKQIVQSEDSEKDEVLDDAYLSDKDRSFDRETMARKIDKFKQGAKGGGKPKKKPKEDMELSDLGAFPADEDPFEKAAEDYSKKKRGINSEETQSEEQVSSTNDHVEDVPLGDITNLNTAEYKYYGFYHRIRQRLEQFWGASIQEKAASLVKEGRQLSSSEELITSLQVTLNNQGEIVSIKILGTSGVRELDNAAIESFNDAGPFPNPPDGLLENGLVTIEWGFVVQT